MNDVSMDLRQAQLLLQQRNYEAAIGRLSEALRRSGPSRELLYTLALAQQAVGDSGGAIVNYRHCVRLDPSFAEAHNNLGSVLERLGHLEESIECFRAALLARPDYLRALTNLGNAQRRLGQPAAADTLRRALALSPNYAPALCNLGQFMLDAGRLEEAANLFERTLAAQPSLPEAHYGLGKTLFLGDRYTGALDSLDRAVALAPKHVDAHLYRGQALQGLDRHQEALESFEAALELKPDSAEACNCRGVALGRLGRFTEAIVSYERALELAPDYASAQWNQALLRLTLGDFASGWRLFESRLRVAGLQDTVREFGIPQWRGESSPAGKIIWVHAEYGLGDTIQFCRYVQLLRARGAEVIFEAPRALTALMRSLGPGIRLIAQGESNQAADYHCPLMSLPLAFATELHDIPTMPAYLHADPAAVEQWATRIPRAGLRIGIAWRGNAVADIRGLKGRAIPLPQFETLLDAPQITLVSLQKGAGTEELATVGFLDRIVNFGDSLDPGPDAFLDTAAVMMNLDLIVTLDTSVAHLAGALGVPVWVALHTTADWRWLLQRSDSPWYPRMRLFRQAHPGDWATVFAAMAAELRDLLRGCH